MPPRKKRPPQTDNVDLGYTVNVQGTDPHLMLEEARLEAARTLRVSPGSLFITSHTSPQPVKYTPFRANLSVPLHVEALAMSVSFKIKEDVNTDEQGTTEAGGEDPLDEG
jgi:hypothetical protein